jgi:recombinational DNA repair protein RecT
MSTKISRLESDQVKEKFAMLLAASHGIKDHQMAASFYEKEKFFFMKLMEENQKLKEATELSQIGTFLDVVSNGLTFEKIQNHVYVMVRNTKVGDSYEQRMSYEVAKNGAIYLVKKSGAIKDITEPVIVYEGDRIDVETENGILNIKHASAIPRKSNKILGAFCFVITVDNRREGFWFPIDRVERLKTYSAKQNKRWDKAKNAYVEGSPNELYTSGKDGQVDEGFFVTKVVKAAIKNYSKKAINLGVNNVDDGAFVDENLIPESFESDIEKYVDQDVLAESESTSSDNDDNVPIF